MKKDMRVKALTRLSKSDLGDALIDFLKEKSKELKDGSNYSLNDFEIDGKASIKAAAKIEELIFLLNNLKEGKTHKRTSFR